MKRINRLPEIILFICCVVSFVVTNEFVSVVMRTYKVILSGLPLSSSLIYLNYGKYIFGLIFILYIISKSIYLSRRSPDYKNDCVIEIIFISLCLFVCNYSASIIKAGLSPSNKRRRASLEESPCLRQVDR